MNRNDIGTQKLEGEIDQLQSGTLSIHDAKCTSIIYCPNAPKIIVQTSIKQSLKALYNRKHRPETHCIIDDHKARSNFTRKFTNSCCLGAKNETFN